MDDYKPSSFSWEHYGGIGKGRTGKRTEQKGGVDGTYEGYEKFDIEQ